MKILINTPYLKISGGVTSFYNALKPYWKETVRYNEIGKHSEKKGNGKYRLPLDIVRFICKLLFFRPDVVLLNPSLNKSAMVRDFIFLNIATFLKIKVVVFIRGYDAEYANSCNHSWLVKNLNKASMILVLANEFKDELQSFGVKVPFKITTTKVDDKSLEGFDIECRKGKFRNIVFLSRIEPAKGLKIVIDTYAILKAEYHDITLTVIGDGSARQDMINYVEQLGLKDVRFTGRLGGIRLAEEMRKGHFGFFPTSYGEGMPNTVLEHMAFGMPVFTRFVGGLKDFFEDGKMGYITYSLEPMDYADALRVYLDDEKLCEQTAKYNYEYAQRNFLASIVACQMENILQVLKKS